MHSFRGFNLIELLIVLSIVGLLTAISLPFYSQHIVHEKRLEAAVTLNKLAIALEHYFIIHNTYQQATLEILGFTEKIADNGYELVLTSATDSDFIIEAKPLLNQAQKDNLCATLTLNSRGEKGITGTGNITDCW